MMEFLGQAWDWIVTINFKVDLLPWLPPMVTLLGWWVVNRQNNQRVLPSLYTRRTRWR